MAERDALKEEIEWSRVAKEQALEKVSELEPQLEHAQHKLKHPTLTPRAANLAQSLRSGASTQTPQPHGGVAPNKRQRTGNATTQGAALVLIFCPLVPRIPPERVTKWPVDLTGGTHTQDDNGTLRPRDRDRACEPAFQVRLDQHLALHYSRQLVMVGGLTCQSL